MSERSRSIPAEQEVADAARLEANKPPRNVRQRRSVGFSAPEITFYQPVLARGENKRFLELSVSEAGPAFVEAGLITAEELESTLEEMRRLNADETVLAVMPRMTQVWARKPALSTGGSK
jgi:hypothetical protein